MHITQVGDANAPAQHFEIRDQEDGPIVARGTIAAGFAASDTFRLTYELQSENGDRPSAAAVNAFLAQRLEMAELRNGVWYTGAE